MKSLEDPTLLEVGDPVERREPDFRDFLRDGYGLEGASPPPVAGMTNGPVNIEQEDPARVRVVPKIFHGLLEAFLPDSIRQP